MTEQDFAKKIRRHLDRSTQQINGMTLQRLTDIRRQALSAAALADRKLVMAQHSKGSQAVLGFHHDAEHGTGMSHFARTVLMALIVMSFIIGMVTWQRLNSGEDEEAEQGFLDAKMLASELPVTTFTHPDFKEWLNGSR
jgi:Protein of unknown function (DUF3619)